MTHLLLTALRGAIGGVIATIPMTAVMVYGQRATDYGLLPPEALVKNAVADGDQGLAGTLADDLDDDDDELLEFGWQAAHLAAGAAFGALYTVAFRPLTQALPRAVSGALFGLAVWFVSYQGVAPALELLPPASDDNPDRQRTNAAAHLVFGTTLGLLEPSREADAGAAPA